MSQTWPVTLWEAPVSTSQEWPVVLWDGSAAGYGDNIGDGYANGEASNYVWYDVAVDALDGYTRPFYAPLDVNPVHVALDVAPVNVELTVAPVRVELTVAPVYVELDLEFTVQEEDVS